MPTHVATRQPDCTYARNTGLGFVGPHTRSSGSGACPASATAFPTIGSEHPASGEPVKFSGPPIESTGTGSDGAAATTQP
ncbi:hypothetical protein A3216_09710 [Mycobacterium leprae 7935681]|nr:hypothetical protein A3216_09710 [Mycobacterium leprae 7935681]